MPTVLFTHAACAAHDPGDRHPESPARLAAILKRLEAPDFAALAWRDAPAATVAQIARVHPEPHIGETLAAVPAGGHRAVDPDTHLSPGSGEAALRAAGAACAAVDTVLGGAATTAFCAVRPPGHHAEPGRAMGFCLFNNVAVAARHAQAAHGLGRVAVVDFDVHHGNGTQAAFAADPTVFYGSTHQSPLYPGTGGAEERGVGNIVNLPLPPGTEGTAYRRVVAERLLPALDAFAPELILVSAGFDAHMADPLGGLALTEADFAWLTEALLDLADRHCGGRLVSVLEGGYDLDALAASVAAHLQVLMTA